MPPRSGDAPPDSILKKRERDRRAQQSVRNKRTALVHALEQRIATLEGELQNARGTSHDLRQEVNILRGRQDSLQHLVASWGGNNDVSGALPSLHPTGQSPVATVSGGAFLPSPKRDHYSTQKETRGMRKDPVVTGKLLPVPSPAPASTLKTTLRTTADSSLDLPRWNMLPAHIPWLDMTVTTCFNSWIQRPDLARASPESPQPQQLLYGSKKNFLANIIYETIRQWPCREVERLAIGWLTYYMIKWMVQPSEERFERLQPFQQPTPEQLCHQHPYHVDFNFWPEMRTNLIRHSGGYDDLNVVGMMSCCLKVRWPWNAPFLEPTDDDQLVMKPEFYNTFTDLRGWGLTKEFLDKFPMLVEGLDPSIRYEIG